MIRFFRYRRKLDEARRDQRTAEERARRIEPKVAKLERRDRANGFGEGFRRAMGGA